MISRTILNLASCKRGRLTRMWVAEGFIKPEMNRTLEEIADANLNELVARSLIQVSEVNFYGRVTRCRVHDIIHDLIVRKSAEENFCMSLAEENTGLNDNTRRLSIYNGESVDHVSEYDSRFLSGVRSVFMLRVSENPAVLSSFRLLKVLTLEGTKLERFPSKIVNLFHLRYLNMRQNWKELVIPNSIGKLQNLQTLDLKGNWLKVLPDGILKLKQLRHLLISMAPLTGGKIPTRIGNLTSLQKLAVINVEQEREVVKELGTLKQLRKLGIEGLRREDGETLCDSMGNMNHLQSLSITSANPVWISSAKRFEEIDISSLSKYSLPLLRSIQLEGPLPNLSNLLPSFQSLVKLALRWSRLRDDPLKSLQYLPYLAFLRLWDAYEGEELSCECEGFQRLKVLSLRDFSGLKCVRFEKGAMPVLKHLSIGDCPRLEEVPIGIEHIASLKRLNLGRVSQQLERRIRREDGDRVKHIPLIQMHGNMIGDMI